MHNKDGRDTAWHWMQTNWLWIKSTFGGDKSYDDYPRIASNSLATRQQLEEFTSFFEPMQNEPALARVISLGINEIEGRVSLIERDKDAVQRALAEL
jgi:aminopeptidase N